MSSTDLTRPNGHRPLTWVVLAAVAGAVLGLALVPRAVEPGETREVAPLLYGEPLPPDGSAVGAALERVRQRVSGWFNLELPDGTVRQVGYGALGVEIDRARLRALVELATSSRGSQAATPSGPVELIVPLRLNPAQALPTLLELKDEFDRTARDARLDLDRGTVVPERAGRLLDLDLSLANIEHAISQGQHAAALTFRHLPPRRLAAQLAKIRHEVVLGAFDTPYDRAARAAARTFNLRLAASRLDGYVLMPGEEFDFNAVVGPRDEAAGYQVAKVIASGELVDGLGGGTCQISGTLYAAALLAGLEITERHPHTRPSSYIKLGFDAAVVYPTINLRLRNPYPFPVVIRETVAGGRVRAEIRGESRPKTVTLVRRIERARPYEEVERPDETLPSGRRVLAQRGVPGFDLRMYRILHEGSHAVREVVNDRYPPTSQVVRMGTSTTSVSARSSSDPQPEYLADELLVLVQESDPEARPVETRTPGRFGRRGWTKEIGAPVWDPSRP